MLYKKQRNVCAFLLKKAKEKVLQEPRFLHSVTDTKKFWKSVKPVFRNKVKTCNTISLIEKSTVLHQKKHLLKPLTGLDKFTSTHPNFTCVPNQARKIQAPKTKVYIRSRNN